MGIAKGLGKGLSSLPAVVGGKKGGPSVLSRAVAAWSASDYNPILDALTDLTGNGHHAQLGSAVGYDTNDPTKLFHTGTDYFWFPGTAGNNIALANPTNATVYYRVYRSGTTSVTGNSSSNPILFGDTKVSHAGYNITSIALTNPTYTSVLTTLLPSNFAEPYSGTTSIGGRNWTINRSATGLKTAVVTRSTLLLGDDDYLIIPSDSAFDIPSGGELTAYILMRAYMSSQTNKSLLVRRAAYSGGSQLGWRLGHVLDNNISNFVRASTGATVTTTTPMYSDGVTTGLALVKNASDLAAWSDTGYARVSPPSGSIFINMPIYIGADGAVSPNYAQMEFFGAAVFSEALSNDDLAALKDEF